MRVGRLEIPNTALKSWDLILSDVIKYIVVRTHPQELQHNDLKLKIGVFFKNHRWTDLQVDEVLDKVREKIWNLGQ